MRGKAAMLIAAMGLVATMTLGLAAAAWGAPAPVDPGPTAAHPFQGLRLLTVATVPAVPGMQFSVDGRVFAADALGVASTVVTKAQRDALRADRGAHLTVVTPVFQSSPTVRARFTGWSGPGQYRNGALPEEYQRATFDIDYLTAFGFTTKAGAPVASKTISSMQLTSSLGDRIRIRSFEPRWLQGSRTATGALGLQSRSVSYRIDGVTASGTNVVNQGQQQFFPSRGQKVTVRLLFFNVEFSAKDALFGSAAGSSVALEYPDGHQASFPFGAGGSVTVPHLPRGTYYVTVQGAGPEMSQKLTVSRSQRADFDAITWIDLALGAALLALIVGSLFLVRRWVRKRGSNVGVDVAEAEGTEMDQELVGSP